MAAKVKFFTQRSLFLNKITHSLYWNTGNANPHCTKNRQQRTTALILFTLLAATPFITW